jgi:large subunit ribosomal protein L3
MKAILGKKLGMTQVFGSDDRLVPVTVIEAGPCSVLQSRIPDRDGYQAVQVGYDEIRKGKNVSKAMMGHFKKSSAPAYRFIREVRMEGLNDGDLITVDIFSKGESVSVTGNSKGKGFQGVMKRHKFRGGPASHGSMFNRAPGSMGSSAYPSRVWKNKALPGHMGDEKVTVKNLTVFDIRKDQNLMLVLGAVPGASGSYLVIRSDSPVSGKE